MTFSKPNMDNLLGIKGRKLHFQWRNPIKAYIKVYKGAFPVEK
jgi:hypothetical protein